MKNKAISILFGVFLMYGLYLLLVLCLKLNSNSIKYIKANSGITKGVVTGIHLDDKHSISVRYQLHGKIYDAIDNVKVGSNAEKGDSILIRYSIEKPDLMITELNNGFYK